MTTDSDFFPPLAVADDNCAPVVARIEHIDEQTPLGFSALDVLTRLAGARSSPLVWIPPQENQEYLLTYGPEQGPSTLAFELRALDGPILYRYRAPLLLAPEDTTCDGDGGALQIPVSVTLQSTAQGLAESFDAVLEANVPYRAHLSQSFEPGSLRGSLGLAHVSSLDPERSFWLGPVTLNAELWEGGSAGSLSVYVGASHAKESKALRAPPLAATQPGSLAAWPSAAACEGAAASLPSDARVLGFSVQDVLAELREGGPRQLTWSNGSTMSMRLELDADEAELCQEVGEALSFAVTLRAQSDDGGLDVRLPVRVDALDAGGRIGEINIESAEPDAPYPIAAGATGAGTSVDMEGYRAVLVGLEWTHARDRDTGTLSLRGVDAQAPDRDGAYPSTAITSGRW
jgi:hypothetical protein